MAVITIATLQALNLGYLTGEDLIQWCAAQLLIHQYTVDNNSLENGCNFAYSEMIASLGNRYDINTELTTKTGTARARLSVKICALLAIENALGNAQNISEKMRDDFNYAHKCLMLIRQGEMNLPITYATVPVASDSGLICQSFGTIG